MIEGPDEQEVHVRSTIVYYKKQKLGWTDTRIQQNTKSSLTKNDAKGQEKHERLEK